jgi:bifunctional non-homologous end joining protein LigD
VAAAVSEGTTFEGTKAFVRGLATALEVNDSGRVLARSDRAARAGRVYVDWIQNDRNRQLVAPYSPRAVPIPNVSTPLAWDEVEAAARGRVGPLRSGFADVVRRIERFGDLWAGSRPASVPGVDGPVATRRGDPLRRGDASDTPG